MIKLSVIVSIKHAMHHFAQNSIPLNKGYSGKANPNSKIY